MRRIVPALASLAALCAVTGAIFALRPVAPVVSLLAFNFFFLEPVHTLRLRDSENWVAISSARA
jgi:K+-sensing histidine kinase KdpD